MRRLLLSAAAVAIIAGPAAALAQPDTNWRDQHHDAGSHPTRPATQAPEARPAQRHGAPEVRTQRVLQRNDQQRFARPQQGGAWSSAPERRTGPAFAQPRGGDRNDVWRNQTGRNDAWRNQAGRNESWRTDHRRDGEWRNGGWRGAARDNGWWRGRRGFESYEGRRDGYWFAPGWGYYRPDPRWYGYNWGVGAVVPYSLRSYYVSDPYAYGLPAAPYGCAWIYIGNQLALVDLASGRILQIGYGY